MTRRPPISPLFPSTTLFRSTSGTPGARAEEERRKPLNSPRTTRSSDRKSTRLNSSHSQISYSFFFFFNDPAPPDLSPLSLHDALPIYFGYARGQGGGGEEKAVEFPPHHEVVRSEEHTSELQSQSNLLFLLFFF